MSVRETQLEIQTVRSVLNDKIINGQSSTQKQHTMNLIPRYLLWQPGIASQ